MIGYAAYKFTELSNLTNYRLMEENQEFFYEETDSFGSAEGFHLAVGLVSFDGGAQGVTEDPEYG